MFLFDSYNNNNDIDQRDGDMDVDVDVDIDVNVDGDVYLFHPISSIYFVYRMPQHMT